MTNRSFRTLGEKKEQKMTQWQIGLILILLLFFAGEILFNFFILPHLRVNTIHVEKNIENLSREELLKWGRLDHELFYYNLKPEDIKQSFEAYPQVRKAFVEKIFPSSLRVILYGRKAVAAGVINKNGESFPVFFDKEGVVFRIGEPRKEGVKTGTPKTGAGAREFGDLPIISGLKFTSLTPGIRVPRILEVLFRDLSKLRESGDLYNLISEIRIVKKGEYNFETILYFTNYPVRVRLGRRIDADRLKYILLVLDSLKEDSRIREIDFRTREIILKKKDDLYE